MLLCGFQVRAISTARKVSGADVIRSTGQSSRFWAGNRLAGSLFGTVCRRAAGRPTDSYAAAHLPAVSAYGDGVRLELLNGDPVSTFRVPALPTTPSWRSAPIVALAVRPVCHWCTVDTLSDLWRLPVIPVIVKVVMVGAAAPNTGRWIAPLNAFPACCPSPC